MKLKEGELLEIFLKEFEEVIKQLKEYGNEMSNEDLVCNILLGLPKLYETVVTVIENIPDITFDIVKKKLLGEHEKRKLLGAIRMGQDTYVFSETDGTGCHRCGKIGHFKRECSKVLEHGAGYRGFYHSSQRSQYIRRFRRQGRSRYQNNYRSNYA